MTVTAVPNLLSEPLIEFVAQRFRVVGEPMGIKLLHRQREGDPLGTRAPNRHH